MHVRIQHTYAASYYLYTNINLNYIRMNARNNQIQVPILSNQ